ncbi:MAG: hypothetical protein MJ238_06950 [Bacilli bacterium]|nr:hypothetical protein [Bacilli bacterium]
MLDSNLLHGGSTNIRLACSALEILEDDCGRFGFEKNGKPNICYILNKLICEMTKYRDKLHEQLLSENEGNEKIVKIIERSIFNTYLNNFSYISDDTYFNVAYRMSKEFKRSLEYVFFEVLEKYDTDFATYVRSIVYEYCSKNDSQRELLLNYSNVEKIRKAIQKKKITKFMSLNQEYVIVPVAIEVSPDKYNDVIGFAPDKVDCYLIPISSIQIVKISNDVCDLDERDYDVIAERYQKFIEREYKLCLPQKNT